MQNEQFYNPGVEDMIGKMITILPHNLLNRKGLFTTQNWIDDQQKLRTALRKEEKPPIDLPPSGHLWLYNGQRRIVMADGNHRTGIACLYQEPIDIEILDIWTYDKPPVRVYSFNVITSKLKWELSGVDGVHQFEP
jgi:hypothetical protein